MIHVLEATDNLLGPEDKVLGAILTIRQVKEGPLIKRSELAGKNWNGVISDSSANKTETTGCSMDVRAKGGPGCCADWTL